MISGSSVILMALALADTLNLLSVLFSLYLQENFNINLEETTIGCKINRYLKFILGYYANWLVIVFTIFRVIAVYLPHKVNVYCTRKRAYTAVVCTFAVCCTVHLDSLVHIDVITSKERTRCWFEGSRYVYYTYHFRWVLLAFMSMLPFACLMIGNCMIIYRMVKYNVQRKRMSHSNHSNKSVTKDSQSMTAMLISISLLFVITQTPAVVTSILRNSLSNEPRSKEYLMTFNVVSSFWKLLRVFNNVLNFLCYCISGTRFREELVLMLKDVKCCKRIRQSGNLEVNDASKSEVTESTINM